ncbi:MAG: FkbM family methyltransferase [Parcubacteria group bacterium]|nr:FkbM family methyltransferase [Parcubacteria group bacterium]
MGEVFSPGEVKVLKETLKPGMTFVDVGANVGYFTLLAARLVGEGGSVYAFEPEDENFGLLKRNVKENGYSNVITEKKALSNCSGNLAFYIDPKNLCAHSLVPKKGRKEVTIEATTFDEYFVGILPDVVKIDVEGAEPQVLSGMVESLKKKPTLIVEFYPEGLRRAGQDPREYLESIESLGYTFFQITESGSVEVSIETLMSGDSFNKLTNLLCR